MAATVSDTLLPSNATAYERAMEAATARLGDVPVPLRESWNPDTCPVPLLPWLASAFSVDAWNTDWTEAQKRQTIRDSVFVHRHKGTIGAVRGALASLGFGARIQEWFKQTPAGNPYTYRLLLEVSQVGIDQAGMLQVQDVVASTKNLRSHLDTVDVIVTTRTGPVIGGVASMGNEITCAAFQYSLVADGSRTASGTNKANGFKLYL